VPALKGPKPALDFGKAGLEGLPRPGNPASILLHCHKYFIQQGDRVSVFMEDRVLQFLRERNFFVFGVDFKLHRPMSFLEIINKNNWFNNCFKKSTFAFNGIIFESFKKKFFRSDNRLMLKSMTAFCISSLQSNFMNCAH
jgi:hypothetical protein